MTARVLAFDASAHRYSVGGAVLPNVSTILKPLWAYSAAIPADVLANKAAIGKAAHRAVELDVEGRLDVRSLHDVVRPYFAAWRAFCAEAHYVSVAAELRVWHPALNFAGTLDNAGWLDGAAALIDVKCTVDIMPSVGPQTAAYREALAVTPDVDDALRELAHEARRWCLQLRPDGTYRMLPQDDPNDWRVFLALLTLQNFKAHHAKHYQ